MAQSLPVFLFLTSLWSVSSDIVKVLLFFVPTFSVLQACSGFAFNLLFVFHCLLASFSQCSGPVGLFSACLSVLTALVCPYLNLLLVYDQSEGFARPSPNYCPCFLLS